MASLTNNEVKLTSDGLTITKNHHDSGNFTAKLTLTKDLELTVTFSYDGTSGSSQTKFNYDVGYFIKDNKGNEYLQHDRLTFSYGTAKSIKLTKTLPSSITFPCTFAFLCQACSGVSYKTVDGISFEYFKSTDDKTNYWTISDNRHTHESAPSAPTISNITCNSIKVTGGEYVREGSNGTWYTSPHTFTGYDHNTSHTYYAANLCSCGEYFISSSKTGTTLAKESKPSIGISASTGKTITISGGEQAKKGSGSWGTDHKFEGLTQGTSYTFYVRNICVCGDATDADSATYKTWDISGSCTAQTTKSLIFKATHTAGSKDPGDTNNEIVYKLYTQKEANDAYKIGAKIGKSGAEVKFEGLDPNTTYYCHAYTHYMADNDIWINGKTKQRFTIGTLTLDASAKSIRVKQTWTAKDSTGIVCSITCNGKTKTTTTSGEYIVFNNASAQGSISPGTEYTIYVSIEDSEGNSSTKSGTIKTKQTTINTIAADDITSKIIRVSGKSNYTEDKMELKIDSGSWVENNQNTKHIFNDLTHDTSHTVYCRIKDCYKYSITDGSVTTTNDSEVSISKNTYPLSLTGSILEEHQHQIITLWQAKVNNVDRNTDAIDNTEFTFVANKIKTKAKKNNPPYQAAEVTEGDDGIMSANYQIDNKIYSNNLTWYYCEYEITGVISDGYNEVTAEVTAHTTFPYSWIYINGSWKRVMPYIYTNNNWEPAVEHNNIYTGNGWKESNGE